MTSGSKLKIFSGTFVHCINQAKLEIIPRASIGVLENDGTIVFVDKTTDDGLKAAIANGYREDAISNIEKTDKTKGTQFFFPGFFDTHIHASQYPNNGIFGKSTLLDWLDTYTFPLESSFDDLKKAKDIYSKIIDRTLSNGTTTAAYYATIHVEATKLLADIALSKGQRAYVGRVCMNQNSPDFYIDESEEASYNHDKKVIDYIKSKDPSYEIISPILTPRFAPTCTHQSMKRMSELMKQENIPLQTHISENKNEIKWVAELFPSCKSYTDVYDSAGVLTKKTILAHAIHLSDEELQIIKKRDSGISHCPISNSSITSGEAPIRDYLTRGLKVGLGTDCSGGFSPSILESARHALLVSRHLAMDSGKDTDKLSIEEVLFLGTLGGAKVCEVEEKLGNFLVGKKFDAQLVDIEAKGSPIDVFEWQRPQPEDTDFRKYDDLLNKWVFNGDDRNTTRVFVNGSLVFDRTST